MEQHCVIDWIDNYGYIQLSVTPSSRLSGEGVTYSGTGIRKYFKYNGSYLPFELMVYDRNPKHGWFVATTDDDSKIIIIRVGLDDEDDSRSYYESSCEEFDLRDYGGYRYNTDPDTSSVQINANLARALGLNLDNVKPY